MAVNPCIHDRQAAARTSDLRRGLGFALTLQRCTILTRHHGEEMASRSVPLIEQTPGARTPSVSRVLLDEATQRVALAEVSHRNQIYHRLVALLPEQIEFIEDERQAATHASGEVAPGLTQHHYRTAGHVFAAVIADAFDDGNRAAVAHRESLARRSCE